MSELRGYALQSGWRDRPRALNARGPALNMNPKTCHAILPANCNRREESAPQNFAEGSSILIVVPTGIRIVVVPMMPLVPAAPPIFVRVPVVSVARVVIAVVIRSLVSRADVNAEAFIRFGSGWCQTNQSECCQSQKEKSFHIDCSVVRGEWDGF